MLHRICRIIQKDHVGIYRDDGLAVIKKQSGYKTENLKKKLHQFSHNIGLGFELEGPVKKTIFLDLSLDMQSGNYAPFREKRMMTSKTFILIITTRTR